MLFPTMLLQAASVKCKFWDLQVQLLTNDNFYSWYFPVFIVKSVGIAGSLFHWCILMNTSTHGLFPFVFPTSSVAHLPQDKHAII